jgi:hypothetical protein
VTRPALLVLVSVMGLSLGALLLNFRVLLTTLADHGAARARRAKLHAPQGGRTVRYLGRCGRVW